MHSRASGQGQALMNKQRWDSLLGRFGIQIERHTYCALDNAYSEKHRSYHTQSHIKACLDTLDSCTLSLSRIHEIEMAFWFHDAIYKIYSSTNEEDSALWSARFLEANQVDAASVSRVYQYILDTKHNAVTTSLEASVVVDIDLAILGSEPVSYDQFEKAIAYEYQIVPAIVYRKKRRQILRSFMSREHIYQTDYYRERYEDRARLNLKRAIDQLS